MIKIVIKTSLILLAIALLYVAGFSMLHGGNHQECAAANIAGGECVLGSGIVEAATFHLGILKRISMGNITAFVLGTFVILLVFSSGFLATMAKSKEKQASPQKERIQLFVKTLSLRKKLDWLITREKRDPSIRPAVSA